MDNVRSGIHQSFSKEEVRIKGCSREFHMLTAWPQKRYMSKMDYTLWMLDKVISRGHISKSIRLTRKILSLSMQGSKKTNHTRHWHLIQTKQHTFGGVQWPLQKNQCNNRIIIMLYKECTFFLCNFTRSYCSCTFMCIQLRELFKSSILIKSKTSICTRTMTFNKRGGKFF